MKYEVSDETFFKMMLEYEIIGCWWAWLVPWDMTGYFIRKTQRKIKRLERFRKDSERFKPQTENAK